MRRNSQETTRTLLSWVTACLLGACSPTPELALEGLPAYLQPVAGATDARVIELEHGIGVSYRVETAPRDGRLLSTISEKLGSEWTPRRRELWDIDLPRDEAGWISVEDSENGEFHQWATQWENTAGDVVVYTVSYLRSRHDRAGTVSTVEVQGWQTPSALIERHCDLDAEPLDLANAVLVSDILVLRRVSETPSAGRKQSTDALGAVYYFDPYEAVLRGESFLRESVQVLDEPPPWGEGDATVVLCLTGAGRGLLEDWSRRNIANYLGFFFEGGLTYAPLVSGVLRDGVLKLPAPSLAEAQLIRQRLVGAATPTPEKYRSPLPTRPSTTPRTNAEEH